MDLDTLENCIICRAKCICRIFIKYGRDDERGFEVFTILFLTGRAI